MKILIERYKSLEDLLDECGDNFLELSVGKYKKSHVKQGFWWATRTYIDIKKSIFRRIFGDKICLWVAGDANEVGWQWIHKGEGQTPREAVLNLLMEMKK